MLQYSSVANTKIIIFPPPQKSINVNVKKYARLKNQLLLLHIEYHYLFSMHKYLADSKRSQNTSQVKIHSGTKSFVGSSLIFNIVLYKSKFIVLFSSRVL